MITLNIFLLSLPRPPLPLPSCGPIGSEQGSEQSWRHGWIIRIEGDYCSVLSEFISKEVSILSSKLSGGQQIRVVVLIKKTD